MRAVVAEALPELVALSVFDVQMVDPAPTTNIWFESYAGESGASASVVDEVIAGSLVGWTQLANKRLQPGTVVLTNSDASVTYVEGTDYVVDYLNGRVMALATITEGQSLKIDYTYDAIRRGEMAAIKKGKNTLTSMALTIGADRLAAEISNEAVVFSRAALGYDVRSRLLMRLIRQIGQKIDGGRPLVMGFAVLATPSLDPCRPAPDCDAPCRGFVVPGTVSRSLAGHPLFST